MASVVMMSQRREDRKLLIVMSDGEADDVMSARDAVAVARSRGIEVIGVGICDHHIMDVIPERYEIIQNLDELQERLIGLLQARATRSMTQTWPPFGAARSTRQYRAVHLARMGGLLCEASARGSANERPLQSHTPSRELRWQIKLRLIVGAGRRKTARAGSHGRTLAKHSVCDGTDAAGCDRHEWQAHLVPQSRAPATPWRCHADTAELRRNGRHGVQHLRQLPDRNQRPHVAIWLVVWQDHPRDRLPHQRHARWLSRDPVHRTGSTGGGRSGEVRTRCPEAEAGLGPERGVGHANGAGWTDLPAEPRHCGSEAAHA
ncbi:MAG: VWA domain-containing protein [Xanthomonadales bacterium]|nr:VWA domain-containing protein [Xanthomonadales bacterium]